ncbi:carbon storage regulator CsrA [Bacillus kexueae]|uniref:carbon storage regulator CsrA n=1 Tax=Aeribacillus kexueae TaxID=2078952 RepID=UPI001FAF8E97
MLILSRKLKQSIMIGDDIEITVTAIEGDQVKIGIKAPKNIDIHRKEVYQDIQTENESASQISLDLLSKIKMKEIEKKD